ncbi:MAG: DUF368 domain-containing protein [Holophagales bacterium]|nr:DUF368 domain-containing protein [Holophagales bacterium]MYF94649.1 DUF368 domain-containing protein [Holophagales bacterium]
MADSQETSAASWAPRAVAGGVLMGLANLVPGISGGTMLLAVGIYPRFIEAMADTTRLRLRLQPLLLLAVVAGSGGLAILLLAGVLRDLVVHHRWIMYSAFIGLTLGGVPLVWRLAQPAARAFWGGAAGGFAAMAGLALLQSGPTAVGAVASGPFLLAIAGASGAAAMILPGLSGAYLLLALGQYEPILGAIDQVLAGLSDLDARAVMEAAGVLLPVLVGIAVGATLISNAVRFALRRFRQATLGVLMGLLLGAVVGLWPFEDPASPAPLQAASALGLAGAGFVLTWTVSRFGTARTDPSGRQ